MNKLANLTSNHESGSLVYTELGNSIICISGKNNKKTEKYVNEDIITSFLKKTKIAYKKVSKENQYKNTWQQYPELNSDRIYSSFVIIDKYIYGFFGYNSQLNKYLDSIERLNLENPVSWDIINYKKNENISYLRKNFASARVSNDEILFIGGYDGLNDCPIENYSYYNFKKNEFYYSDNKFNYLENFNCFDFHRNSNNVQSFDINNNSYFACVDERDNIHVIDSKTMQHKMFTSSEY